MEVIETQELELRENVSTIVEHARAINITNPEQYKGAGLFLEDVKTAMKKVDDVVMEPAKEVKRKAEENRKNLHTIFRAPLETAEDITKAKMLDYEAKEERERLAEEQRLNAEIEKRDRLEKEKLRKKAEKVKTPELKQHYQELAEDIQTPVATIASRVPKIAGQSTRKIWKGKVIDKAAFLEFVVNNPHFLHLIDVNQIALNNFASSSKGEVPLSGIEFYQESIMSAGGRK
jgi:uncharacterized protein YoxC